MLDQTAPGALAALSIAFVAGYLVAFALTTLRRRREVREQRERHLADQARIRQLCEADDLKNMFLSAVSHELRTPLTSILGFSWTLLDRHELTDAQREAMLRTLVSEAEHLEDILGNMLDLDQLTRGKASLAIDEVDPGVLVRGVAAAVQVRSSRSIDVQVDGRATLQLDAAKVERIVENLVGNAIKYTATDASIDVLVSCSATGMTLRVDDEGPGIAPELRESIFEPFRRGADAGVPGTGIGLSLVDRFSRMHGGRAWVEDRPGGGSRFLVHLPALDPVRIEAACEAAGRVASTARPAYEPSTTMLDSLHDQRA